MPPMPRPLLLLPPLLLPPLVLLLFPPAVGSTPGIAMGPGAGDASASVVLLVWCGVVLEEGVKFKTAL